MKTLRLSRRRRYLRQSVPAIVHVEPDLSIRHMPAGHYLLASTIAEATRAACHAFTKSISAFGLCIAEHAS
jgi:hypothetical protein